MDTAEELSLPSSAVNDTIGCAFDVGGTQCKVVYKSKKAVEQHGHCTLCCETVQLDGLEEFTRVLKEKAELCDRTVIHTTGVGVRSKVKDMISNQICTQVENLPEITCYVEAFKFLVRTVPKDAVVLPPPEEGYKQGAELAQQFNALTMGLLIPGSVPVSDRKSSDISAGKDGHQSTPYGVTDEDLFPCLLASVGTAGMFNVIGADGSSRAVDGTDRGGKHLMALASLVLGTASYEELMELAEQGDDRSVSVYMKDIKAGEGGDSYAFFPDDMRTVSFGKVGNEPKGCSRREDLARAMVVNFSSELSQIMYWIAKAHGCKRVFVGGGVFKHALVREEFTKVFVARSVLASSSNQVDVEMHFLRHGVYMGALGALLENNKHYSQAR